VWTIKHAAAEMRRFSELMPFEYQIVDAPLCRHGLYPNCGPTPILSYDEVARIHHWYCQHMDEVIALPTEFTFEVIPIAWHHNGPARPTIAMISEVGFATGPLGSLVSWSEVADAIDQSMQKHGLERLRELAAGETLQWHDVLNHFLKQGGIADGLTCLPGETLDWQVITNALLQKQHA
jgi:hypothetical protein